MVCNAEQCLSTWMISHGPNESYHKIMRFLCEIFWSTTPASRITCLPVVRANQTTSAQQRAVPSGSRSAPDCETSGWLRFGSAPPGALASARPCVKHSRCPLSHGEIAKGSLLKQSCRSEAPTSGCTGHGRAFWTRLATASSPMI